jgi:hypothetical protein
MRCFFTSIKFVLAMSFFSLLWHVDARAELDFEDAAFPEFITSARGLAMGNAYINKVDDAWSAFYNPAGLGTVRKPQFHLLNMHLESSTTYMKAVGSGPMTEVPGKVSDSFEAQEMREMLVGSEGKLAHMRANFFPNITVRGMTLGYFFSQRNRAIIDTDDDGGNFEMAERRDQGPVFALNVPLCGGVFKLGASAAYVMRRELNKSFGPSDPVEIDENVDYKKGNSLQLTVGTRLTLPVALLPTVSVVMRNATASKWSGSSSEDNAPTEIEQTVDAGFSITPQMSKMSRIHLEANYKDISNKYDTDVKRRIGFGAEIDFNRRIFLRAGYGDGWGSGGIGVRSRTFIMDLTTYAVDRSLDGFREQEDRRFVLSLSSGI